jgi:hypothetical protein
MPRELSSARIRDETDDGARSRAAAASVTVR